jgi:hypothetical protein
MLSFVLHDQWIIPNIKICPTQGCANNMQHIYIVFSKQTLHMNGFDWKRSSN